MSSIHRRSLLDTPSIGLAEEFLLVDPVTGDPLPCADQVVAAARELGVTLRAKPTQVQVETTTPPCPDMQQVRDRLLGARSSAVAAALRCGARLLAAGVPVLGPPRQPVADAVCGVRIHVQVPDRETAVAVVDHTRPWLPVLLALTANSAIHHGVDTGYASWRSVQARQWPSVSALPSPHRPTVEVRVGDVPATVDESALLASLVRALVTTAAQAVRTGVQPNVVSRDSLRSAYWHAAHDGLTGRTVDLPRDRLVPAVDLLHRLVRHVRPALVETDELHRTKSLLSKVVTHGNGAVRQRLALRSAQSATDLVDTLAQHTLQDWWPHHAA
jgi:glutamate---cysteine ligase / carboxylate-amine ligase